MTDLPQKPVVNARRLLPKARDETAPFASAEQSLYQLTLEEEAEQDEADAAEAHGDYATDEEVRAIWARHGL